MFPAKKLSWLPVLTLSAALVGCSTPSVDHTDTARHEPEQQASPPHDHQDAQAVNSVAAAQAPTLKMTVDVQGHNATIHFATTNFKISPEHYSQEHVPGEGHIHLFVDGSPTKIAVKENTYKIDGLTPGQHQLKAALHTNNHQPYNVEDALEFNVK